eukprot:1143892-Pelagomonas_calceolata.AAC.10
MESVVFGTRRILDNMAAAGVVLEGCMLQQEGVGRALMQETGVLLVLKNLRARPTSINIAGGSTKSELWLQMHADVCNIPFVQTAENEAPMLGAAVLVNEVKGYGNIGVPWGGGDGKPKGVVKRVLGI